MKEIVMKDKLLTGRMYYGDVLKCDEKTLKSYEGAPVDIAPWAYLWDRDAKIQKKPEAYFIPRRLKRLDEVYRTAYDALGPENIKSLHYIEKDFESPLLPKPKDELLTAQLWVGTASDYDVELVWKDGCDVPSPDKVEVRTYPTAWGWFGWTVDRVMELSEISDDGRTWIYHAPEGVTMDFAYNQRVKAATEMIAVFASRDIAVPELHITGKSFGEWKYFKFSVSWDMDGAPKYKGEYETHNAVIGEPRIDLDKKRAEFICLYSEDSRFGNDSKFTFIADKEKFIGATVLLRELAKHPIYVKEAGLYFCPSDQSVSLDEYKKKYEGKKSVREMVCDHPEAESWEEVFEKVRLWRCPDGTEVPEFTKAPAPEAIFRVPDKRFETMYEHAVEQLRGHNMWGTLAVEVGRVTLAMEMAGLYDQADKIYNYFLAAPGYKSDGDFTDPYGSFEWAKSMRHDMGYSHEGTHCSTGLVLYSMMYRYYLKGDKEWLTARLPRLKLAASWIIRELRNYMKDVPGRENLHVAGLMPPEMSGDYALPACDWRWYYTVNSFAEMGLSAFAEVMEIFHDPDAAYYRKEADKFKEDMQRTVKRESLYAPVREGRDGISRSFIPRLAYGGGLFHYRSETNIPSYNMGTGEMFVGALPLAEFGGPFDASDRRIVGTLNAIEESSLDIVMNDLDRVKHITATEEDRKKEEELAEMSANSVRTGKADADDAWFWSTFADLPKCAHNSNLYLREDDIPSFLHFFLNHSIVVVGTNGKMWEHAHPDIYVPCENPDNGTAGWFIENFRNMLVTEDNGILWLAKGTPRSWLADGKTISIEHTFTMYGEIAYSINSNTDKGIINADINVPCREKVKYMKLRLRHPEGKKIVSVKVNGLPYDGIDADGETVNFKEPSGILKVTAEY